MSYGVGCRCGSDPVLPWLWHRLAATALIRPLAWEPPHAGCVTLKRQKDQKKKKKIQHCHCSGLGHCCSAGSLPSLGTSTCHCHSQKTNKQTNKKTKKACLNRWLLSRRNIYQILICCRKQCGQHQSWLLLHLSLEYKRWFGLPRKVSWQKAWLSNSKLLTNTKARDKLQSGPVISGCVLSYQSPQGPVGSLTWIQLITCPSAVTLTKGNHAGLDYRGGGKELSRVLLEHLRL